MYISLEMPIFGFHVIVQDKGMEFHLPAIDATTKVISTENVSLKEAWRSNYKARTLERRRMIYRDAAKPFSIFVVFFCQKDCFLHER